MIIKRILVNRKSGNNKKNEQYGEDNGHIRKKYIRRNVAITKINLSKT